MHSFIATLLALFLSLSMVGVAGYTATEDAKVVQVPAMAEAVAVTTSAPAASSYTEETWNIEPFSYTYDAALYPEGSPGVASGGFVNTDAYPIADKYDAIRRAQNEAVTPTNRTDVYYDAETDTWLVFFYDITVNTASIAISGEQRVYMNGDGQTLRIVTGR